MTTWYDNMIWQIIWCFSRLGLTSGRMAFAWNHKAQFASCACNFYHRNTFNIELGILRILLLVGIKPYTPRKWDYSVGLLMMLHCFIIMLFALSLLKMPIFNFPDTISRLTFKILSPNFLITLVITLLWVINLNSRPLVKIL